MVPVDIVISHLRKYGFETKEPEEMNGGRVLGLRLYNDNTGKLRYKRGNILKVSECVA